MILKMRLLLLWTAFISSCGAKTKPHIIFILADDLGWNDVSFHGFKLIPTPNIDIMARDGIVLNNYYVMPLCTPSRGSFLTGKYPIRLGLQHLVIKAHEPWGLPLGERLLPQYLKELGYSTHGIGKWHLGFYKREYLPTRRGFDSFLGAWSGSGDYYSHYKADNPFYGYDFHQGEDAAWEYEGVYSTDLFTARARRIIESHNTSQPLFLFLCHQAVHTGNSNRPLQAPAKYTKYFTSISDPEKRIYAGMIKSLDQSVGEVFEALEASNMLNDSLVIFSSDNGAAVKGMNGSTGSNWPLRGTKFTLWEGGIRGVGWIWSAHLRSRRRVDNHLFHISDWLPTLYAAAGGNVTKLGSIDGVNQWPALLGSRKSKRKHVLFNIDPILGMESIRKGPFKLIKGSYRSGKYDEWFDEFGNQLRNNKPARKADLEENLKYLNSLLSSSASGLLWRNYKTNATAGNTRLESLNTRCGRKVETVYRSCFPEKSRCLFNVEKDPCEYYNIADVYPEVVNDLEELVTQYRDQAAPPLNKPYDAAADPKFHGDVWVPWRS